MIIGLYGYAPRLIRLYAIWGMGGWWEATHSGTWRIRKEDSQERQNSPACAAFRAGPVE